MSAVVSKYDMKYEVIEGVTGKIISTKRQVGHSELRSKRKYINLCIMTLKTSCLVLQMVNIP